LSPCPYIVHPRDARKSHSALAPKLFCSGTAIVGSELSISLPQAKTISLFTAGPGVELVHLQISAAPTAAAIVHSWMVGKMASHTAPARTKEHKPFYTSFGFQVLVAMVIGLVLGFIARE